MRLRRSWYGTLLASLLPLSVAVGCASGPVPTERIASAGAAIRAATEVGAQGVPQAALHLKLAQDQVEQAKRLIKDGENERAAIVLLRAEADAELAHALAREHNLRADAQRELEKVRSLRGQ